MMKMIIWMKRGLPCILVTVLLLAVQGLFVSAEQIAGNSENGSYAKAYEEILMQNQFLNNENDFSKTHFSVSDLNADGMPELIICEESSIAAKSYYYTYENNQVIEIEGPASYSGFGTLYIVPSRNTYAFFRGGPPYEDVMPYTMIEYRLENHKISIVNEFYMDEYDSGRKEYYRNGKDCSAEEYETLHQALESSIDFVPNTEEERLKLRYEAEYGDESKRLEQFFHSAAGSEIPVYFISNDFDTDGKIEGFGITGNDNGYDLEHVKIYYVNHEGKVSAAGSIECLIDYGNSYLQSSEVLRDIILNAGSAKFLKLGGHLGGSTWLFGVKNGQAYQPEVSGKHAAFYRAENGLFCAESHEGGAPDSYQHYYNYNAVTGEFERIDTENESGTGNIVNQNRVIVKGSTIKGSLKSKSKAFTIKWKKAEAVAGYQIQYSTSKNFTKKTTKIKVVRHVSKTSLTVKKLKSKKKYYVRIRTYKTVSGKVYYSKWSKVKSVKTKK